jgi:type I restriction-modification system DNA methylase subunit
MKSTQPHFITNHLLGKPSAPWMAFELFDLDDLGLAPHLARHVLGLKFCRHSKDLIYFELLVAEQCPKRNVLSLHKGLRIPETSGALVIVIQIGILGALLMFKEPLDPRLHTWNMELHQLSETDRHMLEQLQERPHLEGLRNAFHTLQQLNQGQTLLSRLRRCLDDFPSSMPDRQNLALDLALKLLFLAFVQQKRWLNFEPFYLQRQLERCQFKRLNYFHVVLVPLFQRLEGYQVHSRLPLGALPHLGGGLFQLDRSRVGNLANQWFQGFFELVLNHFSYAAECGPEATHTGVTPEILGAVFENLMQRNDRKALGIFYTPATITHRMARAAIESYLELAPDRSLALKEIRILDPSCGSGSFLAASMEVLLEEHLKHAPEQATYNGQLFHLKRTIASRHLFGIDVHPVAIRLCEVRLWLMMIQDLTITQPHLAPRLPQLRHHLICGDFLQHQHSAMMFFFHQWPQKSQLLLLREKLAHSDHQTTLLKQVERLERTFLRHWHKKMHSPQERPSLHQPGHMDPLFAFAPTIEKGGFDVIIGNPPWKAAKDMPKSLGRHNKEWLSKQLHLPLCGQMDLSLFFLLKGLLLLKQKGILSMLLPGKFLQADYGQSTRDLIHRDFQILRIDRFDDPHRALFHADTFPVNLLLHREKTLFPQPISCFWVNDTEERQETIAPEFYQHPGGMWLIPDHQNLNLLNLPLHWEPPLGTQWLLQRGIVTGDKKTFIRPAAMINQEHTTSWRPLLCGRDVKQLPTHPTQVIDWAVAPGKRSFLRRTFKPFLLAWPYLGQTLTPVILGNLSWIPDQTMYYIESETLAPLWPVFQFLRSEQANRLLRLLASPGKDHHFFFYASVVGKLPYTPTGTPSLPPNAVEVGQRPFLVTPDGRWHSFGVSNENQ